MAGEFAEQSAQTLVFLFGGGTQASISPNAAESFWKNMLEEAGQELKGRKFCGLLLAGFGVPVLEGDDATVFVELTLGTDGCAVDVTREVSERCKTSSATPMSPQR
jgi:hypothetical protein